MYKHGLLRLTCLRASCGGVSCLRGLNLRIRHAVRGFDPERLDEPLVAEPPYTAYTQFIGLTQHDLYHAGQIVILKRVLAAS
jgi:hypothetical protein